MRDADQTGEVGMTSGLSQHALARIDENNGKIGRGRPGHHVARVLLMTRRIGNDEFTLGSSEVTVVYIYGDALFAFCLQIVGKQGKIDAFHPPTARRVRDSAQL